ncbi:type III-A CRISPR-associated protein Cas10/Csm1 [Staphylococcus pseudintermedius]|uniref:type III-A CRISPR-associated protein Cas10/Csm1 n=1 Tax=Staphylococcus pseudintermedius TaxID=283734 RepID=UPI0019DB4558|nr:type III-A CRISPR-associated protein Cas10/Csm1 [Staphylococcus pseudintermedius]EGQ2796186.1 type III-A CRISPR-associated protein Cas10/Csm1 [Staphylococcus pseudintermedius]EGQ2936109.1 type III-A CRISPR-associated protein Cas10/Csm1 [Staphylococcus pseudintermedius]EGQ3885324.1 type III-A CRISPR-associated protein Cas10/Csm1 [Staphylococcus pseudintermedius]EGQ3975036.1 type III-A CRISPR-associated protein Cas10/Csm1 [Staphylococcus pseudintermedius]EGQ4319639.1 type III-A CRISPR-associa
MDNKLTLMYGALLHDIGKVIYRSNAHIFAKGTHSKLGYQFLKQFVEFNDEKLLENVKYHHYKELKNAHIEENSLAYITYIADNIASGLDRRDLIEEGDESASTEFKFHFDKFTPLYSVFNVVNGNKDESEQGKYKFNKENHVEYPSVRNTQYSSSHYNTLMKDMAYDLENRLKYSEEHFASLLKWTESMWQYIPSSTNKGQLIDISLYDHSRITSAIATCIYDFLNEQNITNYKQKLFSNYNQTKTFYEQEAFLILSMDMSGIQSFIFNISGSKALKNLRSRSFYLELMLEVIVDELLKRLHLSRANLLYTGGGHTYLVLPNTRSVQNVITDFQKEIKLWFINEFGIDLSVSVAYQSCSGNALMNIDNQYKQIWQQLSQKLSTAKAQKYDASDIRKLNNKQTFGDRECKECLRSDVDMDEEGLCSVCNRIIKISNDLRDKSFFVLSDKGVLKMPFGKYISVVDQKEAENIMRNNDSVKIYSKNNPHIGTGVSTNLWMCDYDFSSKKPETKSKGIGSYADRDIGIKRLGVLRADIDNLGTTFISGIDNRYNSLSRTATLSRQLSLFFKYELNQILEGYQITSIYSGGDDLFLIGAWDDIVEASLSINDKFHEFTLGKLTLSAGIGIYNAKYPVSKMAFETGMLEEIAKVGDKNQVTLWVEEKVYPWHILKDNILGEKYTFLKESFKNEDHHGKVFLYKILQLLREKDTIHVARLAYLLARSYMSDAFTSQVFKWAQNTEEKEYLITALEYYIYQTREV